MKNGAVLLKLFQANFAWSGEIINSIQMRVSRVVLNLNLSLINVRFYGLRAKTCENY